MGAVDFVVGLDSGCGDYERLWVTTSLRGLAGGTLTVDVLTEGVHSGDASGIVPSSFRIARAVLDRLEDAATGRVLPAEFHAPIPDERARQAKARAAIMGETTVRKYPFAGRTQPMVADHAEALLNRTWRPALSVTGADGFPAIADAGNVLRPRTSLKLSLRLPPPVDGAEAMQALKRLLEADPPHGATVRFEGDEGATGWNAPADRAVARAGARASVERLLRQARGGDGRGRHDPVHGDAGQAVSRRAVPDHRRARAEVQRARAQRVPAHSLCEEADGVRRARAGGARGTRRCMKSGAPLGARSSTAFWRRRAD